MGPRIASLGGIGSRARVRFIGRFAGATLVLLVHVCPAHSASPDHCATETKDQIVAFAADETWSEFANRDRMETIERALAAAIIGHTTEGLRCRFSQELPGPKPRTAFWGPHLAKNAIGRPTILDVDIDGSRVCVGLSVVRPEIVMSPRFAIGAEPDFPSRIEAVPTSSVPEPIVRYAMSCHGWTGLSAGHLQY